MTRAAVVRTITGDQRRRREQASTGTCATSRRCEVRLLTSPLYADHIVPGPTGRVAPGTARFSMLAPPGRYTVRLKVGAVESRSRWWCSRIRTPAARTRKSPNRPAWRCRIRRDLNEAADAVHRIESARVQLQGIIRAVDDSTVRRAAQTLAGTAGRSGDESGGPASDR